MAEKAGNMTFGIIKPDAVRKGKAGAILQRIIDGGFRVRGMKLIHMSKREAEGFYAVHSERPFFGELVSFITSGPVVAMVVEGPDAVAGMRQIMGATNPLEATPGSIRGDFATLIGENIVHGSDSPESAEREVNLFFG